jgi:serine/threonine protein kinase
VKQHSKYKILDLVGRGQFGKVFAAFNRKTGRLVALKELNQKQLSTSNFLRELHFLVSLDHRNIVTCYALEHYQNNRYLVMDYCEGGTLRNLIDGSKQINLIQSLQLVIDILSGLKYAHSQGVIHRDIKPENILLNIKDRNWTARISDFGIAKLHQAIHSSNVGNTGSPAYMAPEQFYGQYSYSCDLYAVGILLFELVVGERPFSGMPKELMSAHLNQPVVIPNSVPFMLRSAIAKSLQKLPHRRFSDAQDMLNSIQLAKNVLTATNSSISLSSQSVINLDQQLTILSTESLSQPATHLAVTSGQVYLGMEDRIYGRKYQDDRLDGEVIEQWEIPLDSKLCQLNMRPQGCFASTSSSVYHLPKNLNPQFLPIISFPTTKLITTIDPQGHWLAISYLSSHSKISALEIFPLPNSKGNREQGTEKTCCRFPILRSLRGNGLGQSKRSLINPQQLNHLIALNRRYGLAIFSNKQQQTTNFHLFNRRGNWLGNFSFLVSLNLVCYNPFFPNRLLATEFNNPDVGLLIDLQPFTVTRIAIGITPAFIIPEEQGYLWGDRCGRMVMVNGENSIVKQFQVPLEQRTEVTAIATASSQLLVATRSNSQAHLQRFSLNV